MIQTLMYERMRYIKPCKYDVNKVIVQSCVNPITSIDVLRSMELNVTHGYYCKTNEFEFKHKVVMYTGIMYVIG